MPEVTCAVCCLAFGASFPFTLFLFLLGRVSGWILDEQIVKAHIVLAQNEVNLGSKINFIPWMNI